MFFNNILFGIVYIQTENSKYFSSDCVLDIDEERLTVTMYQKL